MKSRRITPKNAKKGTRAFQKNWTATGHDQIWYRHLGDGSVSLATRVEKKGRGQAWHTLSSSQIEGAREQVKAIRASKVEKPLRREMPTLRQYLLERVDPAIQNGHQDRGTRNATRNNLYQILDGYRHDDWKTRKNEAGKSLRKGVGACPRQILDKHVDRITDEDLDEWFSGAFLNPYSLSSTKGMWTVWKKMFDLARKDSLIFARPEWKIPLREARGREERYKLHTEGKSRDLDVITTDEFFAVVEEIRLNGQTQDGIAEDSANWAELLGTTGIRRGEIAELRWKHVLWDEKRLVLEGRTKSNRKGAQHLPLNPDAVRVLRRMWASGHTRESYLTTTGKKQSRRVHRGSHDLGEEDFVAPYVSAEEACERACRRLGVPVQTPHCLRHFFACECVDQGIPWSVLADWLGHSDGGIVAARTYAHVRRGVSESYADGWSLGKRGERQAS
jgi:integrase